MNRQVLDSIRRSKYFSFLEATTGMDMDAFEKQTEMKYRESEHNVFANRSHQLLSPNVYIESLLFNEVFNYLHSEHKRKIVIDETVKLDVKTILAVSNSLIQRPNSPNPTDVISGYKDPTYLNNYVIISKFERELVLGDFGRETNVARLFEGLLPQKIEVNPLPSQFPSNKIWDNSFCVGKPFIQGLSLNPFSLEASCVIWMNSALLNLLELKLDNFMNGLKALDLNGEVVLEFRSWRDSLISKGSAFVGWDSNIPRLEGCDLILREDYFDKLKKIIPDVVYYTYTL